MGGGGGYIGGGGLYSVVYGGLFNSTQNMSGHACYTYKPTSNIG